MPLPQIGQTISAEEFNRLPIVGETISAEQFSAIPNIKEQKEPGFFQRAKSIFQRRGERIGEISDIQARGEQTLPESIFQTVGQAVGTTGELGFQALPRFVRKPIEAGAQKLAQTRPGQAVIGGVQRFAEERPRFARNIEAGIETAGVLPVIKGAQIAGRAGQRGLTTARGALVGRAERKGLQEAVELTKPVLGKQETIGAFEKAGKPGGITQKGKLRAITKQPTLKDIEVAQTAQPFINKKAGVSRNLYNLNQEIERFSTSEVRPFLQQNPRIFNIQTFESYLKKTEPPDWIKSDKVGENTYNLVRQRMVDAVRKNPKNMEGLWDSRINFDNIVEQQFGGAVFDPNKRAFVNQAVRDMRKATNDFIGQNVGDKRFSQSMKRLNQLYEARGNIAEQKWQLLDKTFIQRFYKEHPGAAKLVSRIGLGAGGIYGYFQLRDFLGD